MDNAKLKSNIFTLVGLLVFSVWTCCPENENHLLESNRSSKLVLALSKPDENKPPNVITDFYEASQPHYQRKELDQDSLNQHINPEIKLGTFVAIYDACSPLQLQNEEKEGCIYFRHDSTSSSLEDNQHLRYHFQKPGNLLGYSLGFIVFYMLAYRFAIYYFETVLEIIQDLTEYFEQQAN